jgi:hypothetical protein
VKILLVAFLLSGCATVYENGKPVLQVSADMTNVSLETPRGTKFHADTISPSKTVRAYGRAVGDVGVSAFPIVTTLRPIRQLR